MICDLPGVKHSRFAWTNKKAAGEIPGGLWAYLRAMGQTPVRSPWLSSRWGRYHPNVGETSGMALAQLAPTEEATACTPGRKAWRGRAPMRSATRLLCIV